MGKGKDSPIVEKRKEIVEKIISLMEQGDFFNNKEEWNRSVFSPQNPFSNAVYKGGNRIRLMLAAYLNHYNDPRWATFKQISDAGYKVKKGAHGVSCEKWSFYKEQNVKDKNGKVVKDLAGNPMKEIVELEHPVCRSFTLFHASQIEGLPELKMEAAWEKTDLSEIADQLIASSECPVYERNQGRAFYNIAKDEIVLPPRTVFKDEASFVKTALHEMGHSTGNEKRLNREYGYTFGSEKYAQEELVAELSALFVESDMGLNLKAEHYEDHSDYLKSWITVLKNDYSVFFTAVADAEKAADWIIERYYALDRKVVINTDDSKTSHLIGKKQGKS